MFFFCRRSQDMRMKYYFFQQSAFALKEYSMYVTSSFIRKIFPVMESIIMTVRYSLCGFHKLFPLFVIQLLILLSITEFKMAFSSTGKFIFLEVNFRPLYKVLCEIKHFTVVY